MFLPENSLCIPAKQPNHASAPQDLLMKLKDFVYPKEASKRELSLACTIDGHTVPEVSVTHVFAQMGY